MAKKNSIHEDSGVMHHFDLEPGTYAFACEQPMSVVGPRGAVLAIATRRIVVALPEGGHVSCDCREGFAPRVRPIRLSDPVDPVPHEALLTEPRPLTLQEQIARFLGDWERRQKGDEVESFDEADDLDIDDDDHLPLSKYELPLADDDMAPPSKPPVSPPVESKPDPEQVPSDPPEQPSTGDT